MVGVVTADMGVLVTGGAGYIGSHAVLALVESGWRVTVLDDLSTGRREAVPDDVELVEGNAGDIGLVTEVLRTRRLRMVMHFAASVVVPESVMRPLDYYRNNLSVTRNLLEACSQAGIAAFVLSSTAAVYGTPKARTVDENTPPNPISPYGRSKLAAEWMVQDVAAVANFRYMILRYFNVAGADPVGRTGQIGVAATHLVRVACETALGLRPQLFIYGEDYDTPDGTCIRDYIHVADLAEAHVAALAHLAGGGSSETLNCGYGRGISVREVVAVVERVSGRPLDVAKAPRRPGDPVCVVADNARILSTLDWRPRHDSLDAIIRSTLEWERRRLDGATP